VTFAALAIWSIPEVLPATAQETVFGFAAMAASTSFTVLYGESAGTASTHTLAMLR